MRLENQTLLMQKDRGMYYFKSVGFTVAKITLGAAAAAWVSMPHALQLLFWVMLADMASGLIVGGKRGKLSSARGWEGLKKKSLMWILIGVSHLADQLVNVGFHFDEPLAMYFSINEIISVVENCGLMGVRIPGWLRPKLEALQELNGHSDKHDIQK